MIEVWQENQSIRFGNIDRSDRLTLASTFGFFQEAAISHAEALGVGREALAASGQVWILSRISVYMARRPRFNETVTVRTWPRSWEKLFALRDYDILDEAGGAVVRGRSGWLILDMEKRRPLRVQQIVEPLPANEGRDAFSALAPGLESREGLCLAAKRAPAYSDIDYNGHLNNARYIQWLQDITPPEVLEGAEQMRLDINYLSEVKYGDTLDLWSGPLDAEPPAHAASSLDYPENIASRIAYMGTYPDSGKAAFRAELCIGNAAFSGF